MFIDQFFIDGLGCASYLVGDDKTATTAVIDPDRDVRKYIAAAAARGVTITHIVETHLHADHVSGNTELAARTGAPIFLPAGSNAGFPHVELKQGETLTLGDLELRILHTPGHTPESITLLVGDTARGQAPALALTGDTLFVGDVGRPDLDGDGGTASARALAGAMYDSLQEKILPLADGLIVYPGHGAGSLCGRAMGSMRVSTLGYERHANPALAPRTREEFIPLGQLQARFAELDPEVPVAVICQSGNRSQTAAALLAQKGFKQVFNVREGTAGWRRRGFPVEN